MHEDSKVESISCRQVETGEVRARGQVKVKARRISRKFSSSTSPHAMVNFAELPSELLE